MTTRTLTLKLIAAAIATLPMLAQADTNSIITHDGWQQVNGELIGFVGVPGAVSKTRAQVRAEFDAARGNRTSHDGWVQTGDSLEFVGLPTGNVSKTRAQVRAELAAHQRNPVSADGWVQQGDALVFVGQPAPTQRASAAPEAQPPAAINAGALSHFGGSPAPAARTTDAQALGSSTQRAAVDNANRQVGAIVFGARS